MIKRLSTIAILSLGLPLAALAADPGLPPLPETAAAPATATADMAQLQTRINELLAQAKATQAGQDKLSAMVDRLLNATGVKLNGEAVAHSVAFQYFPTAALSSISPTRIWPTVGYFDLTLEARPKPEISASVTYRMEKVFGGFWGSQDLAGVRRFNIHGDTAIGFDFGIFNYKHTPLTLWAPQDEFPYELEILARKRREGRQQQYLGDNAFPLQGARIDGTLIFFDALALEMEGIGVRTAIAGTKNSGLGFAVIFPYDQWLVGGFARFTGSRSNAFSLGASYYELMEAVDTTITPITPAVPGQQRGNVVGGDLKLSLLGDEIVLKGEGVVSNYTYAFGRSNNTWTSGGAGNAAIDLKGTHHHISIFGLYVDEKFINYAAQTRTDVVNGSASIVPTANNLLDPKENDYGFIVLSDKYFSKFNNVIFATNQNAFVRNNQQQAASLQPGSVRCRSLPYGWATPNRAGYGAEAKFNFLDGALRPSVRGGNYAEPVMAYYFTTSTTQVVGNRSYLNGGAGVVLDLEPLTGFGLSLGGGYTMEQVRATAVVNYDVQSGDAELAYKLSKQVTVRVGWEQVSMYGVDYQVPYLGAPAALYGFSMNHIVTSHAIGAEWAVSAGTNLNLNYVHTDYWMPSATSSTYGTEEIESKLSLRF